LRTAAAHNLREIRLAERRGADLLFLSPVFPTRSHPEAKTLGRLRFSLLARQTRVPSIALGGMNEKRARGLAGAYGWAAIDAWS
jgi:thiamine-phosphate pyrophosphorylase